jgi:hypothetical protein
VQVAAISLVPGVFGCKGCADLSPGIGIVGPVREQFASNLIPKRGIARSPPPSASAIAVEPPAMPEQPTWTFRYFGLVPRHSSPSTAVRQSIQGSATTVRPVSRLAIARRSGQVDGELCSTTVSRTSATG